MIVTIILLSIHSKISLRSLWLNIAIILSNIHGIYYYYFTIYFRNDTMNIDTSALASLLNPETQTSTETKQRPDCTLWGNVGVCLKVINNDGESEEKFISLPYGIDLSNMPKRKIGTKDTEYNNILKSSNQLLDMIRQEAENLKPGDKKILKNLTLQILVPEVKSTETSTDGGLLDGISLSD